MAIFKSEGRNGPITIEVDVLLILRRELVVRLYTKESAIDIFWYLRIVKSRSRVGQSILQCQLSQARRYQLPVAKAC